MSGHVICPEHVHRLADELAALTRAARALVGVLGELEAATVFLRQPADPDRDAVDEIMHAHGGYTLAPSVIAAHGHFLHALRSVEQAARTAVRPAGRPSLSVAAAAPREPLT